MGKKEQLLVAILFLICLAVFTRAENVNYYVSQLDAAMMVGNIEATYSEGRPVSQINASVLKALATVIVQEAEEVCAQPLREDVVERVEMLGRHGYFVLYALAPLNAFVSASVIASAFQALAFVGLLFAIYLFLRKEQLAIPATLLFVSFVAAHPAWSLSAFGQFYPDRFFILAGFVYAVLLHRRLSGKQVPFWMLLLTALVASSLVERAAIMIGISTLGMLLLHRDWRGWSRKDIPLAGIATVTLLYALLYMKLVQHNADYASFSSQALSFFSNIQNNEPFRLGLRKYLWVNLPYLILALFEWRMALLALGMMLPNMIGSIGGAEKIGWSTHYHALYFPFVVAAASMGFMRLCRIINGGWQRKALFSGVAVLALYVAAISPYVISPMWGAKSDNIKSNALFKAPAIVAGVGDDLGVNIHADFNKAAAEVIPANVSVSTYEGMMPALLGNGRVLYYYPLGIGNADYLIVSFVRDDNEVLKLFGAVSYLGSQNREAMDACLSQRIAKEYEMVKAVSPGSATGYGSVIFRRVTRD